MFLKQCALFVALFGVSGGATFLYYSQTSGTSNQPGTGDIINPDIDQEITPAEALFMDITSNLKQFNIDGGLYFTYGADQLDTAVTLKGAADISDFSSIKVDALMDVNCSGITVTGNLGYFDETVYVDYNNSHIKLPQADALSFVEILPSLGVNIGIPDELLNLDLNAMTDELMTMEPIDGPDGSRVFELHINKDIDVVFKSNKANQFTGIRTNKFFYKDLYCYADFDIERVDNLELENPENAIEAPKYQLFTPAFGLVEGMVNFFGQETNTVNLVVDLKKEAEGTLNDIVTLKTDISYDRINNKVNLANQILETTRNHKIDMQVADGALYINHADANKISIKGQSVADAITYLVNQITDEELSALLDKLAGAMNGVDPTPILENLMNLNKWIEGTTITDKGVDITFDLSTFDPSLKKLTISLTKDQKTFTGIHLNDFKFQGMVANIDMEVAPYQMPTIEAASYVALDPAMTLVQTLHKMTKNTQFRFEMEGLVDDQTVGAKDITIGGGLQFDIKDKFGYGDITIKDATDYSHKIQADFRKDQQILIAYNNETRAKMTANTIKDVTGFVSELVQKRDDHFMELFGSIIEMIEKTPIYQAVTGDYGLLFATPGISNIEVTDTLIKMNISGALLGMPDVNMLFQLRYDATHIYGIDISNITMGNQVISFTMNLTEFRPELDAQRLDPYLTYFNLTEIKTLLSLGYNTTVPNDFHIRGTVKVSLIKIINVEIPVDIKVFNDKGNVSVAVNFEYIPTILLVNNNKEHISAKNRTAQFYYKDNMIYARRNDELSKGRNYTLTSRIGLTEFLETNTIMDYLLDFTLGLWPTYVKQVKDAINAPKSPTTPGGQIKYESVLKDFAYNNYENYYHISLSMRELAQNAKMNNLNINIYADMAQNILNAIQVDWNVVSGVNIKARLDLLDFGQKVDLTTMTNFIASMQNAPLGQVQKVVK